MRAIARDEARHAALAWRIAAWAEERLPASARREVRKARKREGEALLRGLGSPHPWVARIAGLPDVARARQLVGGLAERLGW
jgi:hypothetical protein